MTDNSLRSVDIERLSVARYVVRNVRGGSITVGTGEDDSFTPVELLLTAIGACSAVDVDSITSRRAEPSEFRVMVTGDKIRDEAGRNQMDNLTVEFTISFPADAAGEAARDALPRAVQLSHDRLCTVSRTVERGTTVSMALVSPAD